MSDPVVTMRQNDTRPHLLATLSDRNGVVDLTGEAIRFVMKSSAGVSVIDELSTDIIVPQGVAGTSGVVKYIWQDGDLDTVGAFLAEFELTDASSAKETFPNQGHIQVVVTPELST